MTAAINTRGPAPPWKFARVAVRDVGSEHSDALATWLAGYDINAADCVDAILITQDSDGIYYLHVSRLVRVGEKPVIDYVTGLLQSTPTVVALGTERPDMPWLTAVMAAQEAAKYDSPIFQRDYETGTVTVLSAPRRTRVALNFFQLADPDALRIDGAELHMGEMPDGQEVVYRVTGWDGEDNVLTLWRHLPEIDPPVLPPQEVPATPDGLAELKRVSDTVQSGTGGALGMRVPW